MYVEIFLRIEDFKFFSRQNKYAIDDLLEAIWETLHLFFFVFQNFDLKINFYEEM